MSARLCVMAGVVLWLAAMPAAVSAGGFKFNKLFRLSRGQELAVAQSMHSDLAKDPGLITKGRDFDQVQRVGNRLVERNQLKEYDYKFFLVKDDQVNAFATPGGYIYVTAGLMKYMSYDDSMLAGVMAHELGHAKDRHVVKGYEKMLQGALGLGVLGIALGKRNQDVTEALGRAGGVVLLKYNRDQEEWADRSGVELSYGAGYDAYGLTRSLECLRELYGSTSKVGTWLANHPATDSRIERTKAIAQAECGEAMGYVSIPAPPKDHPLYKKYGQGKGAPAEVIKHTSPVKTAPGQ